MVGYILRLEADARRNLPGLEYIVAIQIQETVLNAVQAMTGMEQVTVNVHVSGVVFDNSCFHEYEIWCLIDTFPQK